MAADQPQGPFLAKYPRGTLVVAAVCFDPIWALAAAAAASVAQVSAVASTQADPSGLDVK